MTKLRSQLTYANVMASIAVFIALGGSGYAAAKFNGKNIQNHSIIGKKLKSNTLGGTQINEAKLGTVPSAANAGNAGLLAGHGPDEFLGAGAKAADANKLDGKDSTAFLGATAKAADTDKLDGRDSAAFLGQGTGSTANAVGLQWYSYFGNTSQSHDYEFGQMLLRTNSVAGQFLICGNTGLANPLNFVRYLNGVRTAGTVNGNACTAAFDVGAGGDFQVSMRRSLIFGVHSGDDIANENYLLYGLGQL
jgi:hypothetical protein